VITRAIGLSDSVEVETNFFEHEDGDIYLLCSDGLSDPLKTHEMAEILSKYGDDLPRACRELIIAANTNGGPDNVTALLAKTVY
jgi:protein phosphatase